MFRKKKIILDIILSLVSSFIPILFLQFVVLPIIATDVNANNYGLILTIIGIITLLSGSMGSVLNNVKLITNNEYLKHGVNGDFSIFLVYFIIVNILITIFFIWFYDNFSSPLNLFLIILVSTFMLISGYAIVEFRLNLNYKNIMLNSVYLSIGYTFGLILFFFTKNWIFIYLFGNLFSVIFIWNRTTILKEPLVKTKMFFKTRNNLLILLLSGLILSTTVYIDRLLIYPVLGGAAVSIYYTASLLGKTVSLAIQPLANTLLSYLAQMRKIEMGKIIILILLVSTIGIIGFFIVIIISEPLLSIIYPQFVDEALNYIYIATLTSIILVISNVLNPILLKFYDIKWQLSINLFYLLSYIIVSLLLVGNYYIMGFFIGGLIASIIKLVSSIFIIFLRYRENKDY